MMRGRTTPDDLTGRSFVFLKVESRVSAGRWRCRCVCGKQLVLYASVLLGGGRGSCGCKQYEIVAAKVTTHGHSRGGRPNSREYRSYRAMRQRCYNPRCCQYHNYGGRGITVCDRWLGRDGFRNFLADMGPCAAGESIEREDVNDGYHPGNCRWIPLSEQGDNRRNTQRFTIDGRTQTLKRWAAEMGLKPATVDSRLRYGWDVRDAATLPVRAGIALKARRTTTVDLLYDDGDQVLVKRPRRMVLGEWSPPEVELTRRREPDRDVVVPGRCVWRSSQARRFTSASLRAIVAELGLDPGGICRGRHTIQMDVS